MFKKILLCALIVMMGLLLSSCKRQEDLVARKWQSKHLEAKLYDIPVLMNAQLVQNMSNTAAVDESNIISYETNVDYEHVVAFYQEEMERIGWWQATEFVGTETLLNFEKPNKYCSISIRPYKKGSQVIIFMGQKNDRNYT